MSAHTCSPAAQLAPRGAAAARGAARASPVAPPAARAHAQQPRRQLSALCAAAPAASGAGAAAGALRAPRGRATHGAPPTPRSAARTTTVCASAAVAGAVPVRPLARAPSHATPGLAPRPLPRARRGVAPSKRTQKPFLMRP
jgi:hypothetical protein